MSETVEQQIMNTLMDQQMKGERPRCVSVLVSVKDFWGMGSRLGAKIDSDLPSGAEPDPHRDTQTWITLHTPAGPVRVKPSLEAKEGEPMFEGVPA